MARAQSEHGIYFLGLLWLPKPLIILSYLIKAALSEQMPVIVAPAYLTRL